MITYEEVKSSLPIDKHSLDTEISRQAETYFHVSEKLAHLSGERDAAKEQLNRTEALLYTEIGRSEEKLPDTKIKMRVALDPKYQEAQDRYAAAKREVDTWVGLQVAYQQRTYMLRELCDLYLANYYTSDSHSGDQNRKQEVDHASARRAISDVRDGAATGTGRRKVLPDG